ncbi:MAG: hypothetical protein ACXACC_02130 [Promethearchaeota archaeon]|jgi:hypothetical protein
MSEKRERFSFKLLILILSIIVAINIIVAFSYHILYESSLIHGTSVPHEEPARVIMIYHSLSTPFIGIVTLFFLAVVEIREKVIKPIKYIVTLGGISAGIGATFWAYTDIRMFHEIFVVGLALLFLSGLLLFYGLIPGKEVKRSDYYKEIPKIGNMNIFHLSALIVIGGMLVFAIFGALAALMMLDAGRPFFFIEEEFLIRDTKLLYEELASFHMRLISALFLTGILILLFRYTEVKGKIAKIGLWLLLPGTIAMTAGYFLMLFMGKSANAILMPARALILFTGVIIALYGWNQISREELGGEYKSVSWSKKITAVFKNPLSFGMYIPFFLAGLVVVIPGMIIVANLEAYRDPTNYDVELSYAIGHPHTLITLGAIVIFCLIIHNILPKNKIRKIIGWSVIISLLISFPTVSFYFLRSPTDTVMANALKHIILSGLFILFADVLIFLGLIIYQLVKNRENFAEKIIALVSIRT